MTSVIEIIIAKLNEVFAPMDAKVLEESQKWAKERVAALRAAATDHWQESNAGHANNHGVTAREQARAAISKAEGK